MTFTQMLLLAMIVAVTMAGLGAKVELSSPPACGGAWHVILS